MTTPCIAEVSTGVFSCFRTDTDTIIGQGDSPGSTTASLFRMTSGPQPGAAIPKFMTNPEFVPIYYGTLKRLIDTTFSAGEFNPLLDRALGDWVPAPTIATMKSWQAARNTFVLSQIPLTLTNTTPLTRLNGFLYTTSASVSLNGLANAIDTRSVRVNGQLASWNAIRVAGASVAWRSLLELIAF